MLVKLLLCALSIYLIIARQRNRRVSNAYKKCPGCQKKWLDNEPGVVCPPHGSGFRPVAICLDCISEPKQIQLDQVYKTLKARGWPKDKIIAVTHYLMRYKAGQIHINQG